MPYSVLSHTADTGLEATADSLPELIGDLATGMFALMASVVPCPHQHSTEVTVEAASEVDLVVDVLSELLYQSEVRDLVFCRFEVEATGPTAVRVLCHGVDSVGVAATGPPIKAVTYHEITVIHTDAGWRGTVYFDV